jgi:hypothetical protein
VAPGQVVRVWVTFAVVPGLMSTSSFWAELSPGVLAEALSSAGSEVLNVQGAMAGPAFSKPPFWTGAVNAAVGQASVVVEVIEVVVVLVRGIVLVAMIDKIVVLVTGIVVATLVLTVAVTAVLYVVVMADPITVVTLAPIVVVYVLGTVVVRTE